MTFIMRVRVIPLVRGLIQTQRIRRHTLISQVWRVKVMIFIILDDICTLCTGSQDTDYKGEGYPTR